VDLITGGTGSFSFARQGIQLHRRKINMEAFPRQGINQANNGVSPAGESVTPIYIFYVA